MKEGSVYFPLFLRFIPELHWWFYTRRKGCSATPLVSEVSFATSPTGSPFGYHPRLSMVCPRRGQWIGSYDFY